MSRLASQKLHHLAADELARDIVAGRLAEGHDLPSEQALAERFGVSRPVIRAAVQDLDSSGLVHIRHGKRTVVNRRAEWDVLNERVHDAFRQEGLTANLLKSLYELRQLLEPQAAAWAAERAGDEDRARLRRLLDRMSRSLDESDPVAAFLIDDRELHAAVASASANPLVVATMRALHNIITTSWANTAVRRGDLEALLEQHRGVAEAIIAGDAAAASEKMAHHLAWASRHDDRPLS